MKKGLILLFVVLSLLLIGCKRTYKVTFKLYDDVKESQIVEAKGCIKEYRPTRDGYTFSCWLYDDEVFDEKTPITKNLTLTAEWILNDYVVKFYDGDELIKSVNVEYGNKVKGEILEKEDYIFIGWTLNDKLFDFNSPILDNTNLYTRWIKDSEYKIDIKISFNSTGAKTEYEDIIVKRLDPLPTLPEPTYEGHEFLGWYYGDMKMEEGDILKETEDFCLIAKWK